MRATIPSLPGSTSRRGNAAGDREATRWPARPRFWRARSPWLAPAAVLCAVGCFCVLVQGPQWRESAVLASVNLAVSLVFACTGLMLRKQPGQRVTAWALMLAGVFRSVDFIDAWNGAWPAFTTVFGGVDRVFGAWALLRYPGSSLSARHRRYLVAVTGWMLAGRVLIVVTSTARWNGYPPSSWWPALVPDQPLSDTLNYVVHTGEGVLAAALIPLLVIRLARARGLDRVVLTPVTVAGIAAVIATIVSALMMTLSLSGAPNDAYLTESAVDLGIPVAFLVAGFQRLLLEQVKAARARIAEAELAERRRLERDLHDGVQQHLLGITAALAAAMATTTDPRASAAFDEAREGLRAVLGELRDLAHGIHPAVLSQSGLGAALEGIAERLPLPVSVHVPARRLDAAVEATLYFVACEALANVVKHAGAGSALVTVRAGDSQVEMEIADDGAGGVAADAGHGLANIADRVGALDGEVIIDSPPGQGTRLVVKIPCA